MRSDPVAIVGAGPYGLALAAHLRARRVPFRIFGEPMSSWRENMPAGMRLKSELPASSISDPAGAYSLEAFYRESGRDPATLEPVELETFSEYGLWFARALVSDLEETSVRRVAAADGLGFEVELETGERFRAAAVVVAAGHLSFAQLPPELRALPEGVVSHSSAYGEPAPLDGRRVAVLGAGQSALETAVLLERAGAHPTLVARTDALVWNPVPPGPVRPLRARLRAPTSGLGPGWRVLFYSELPQVFRRLPVQRRLRLVRETLGPAGAWWLREAFERSVPVLLGCRLEAAASDGDGVRLRLRAADGQAQELAVDHVVAATGYRVDVSRLDFLDSGLVARLELVDGSPVLRRGFESSVPGVSFVGLAAAASFGPVMRFVYGSGFAARSVARDLRRLSISASSRVTASPQPAPLVGVGIDLVCVEEVEESIGRFGERYLQRIFTDGELAECGGSVRCLATRFALKEAAIKALAPGPEPIPWQCICVVSSESGRPSIKLTGLADELARQRGISHLQVSMAGRGALAAAVVIAHRDQDESKEE